MNARNSDTARLLVARITREMLAYAYLLMEINDALGQSGLGKECYAHVLRASELFEYARGFLYCSSPSVLEAPRYCGCSYADVQAENRSLQLIIEQRDALITSTQQKYHKYKLFSVYCAKTCDRLAMELQASRLECAELKGQLLHARPANTASHENVDATRAKKPNNSGLDVQIDEPRGTSYSTENLH